MSSDLMSTFRFVDRMTGSEPMAGTSGSPIAYLITLPVEVTFDPRRVDVDVVFATKEDVAPYRQQVIIVEAKRTTSYLEAFRQFSHVYEALPNPVENGPDVAAEFAHRVRNIPEVVAVTNFEEGDVHSIRTYIRKRDKRVRSQIYEQEREVIRRHKNELFDFRVLSMENSNLAEELQGRLLYYRHKSD